MEIQALSEMYNRPIHIYAYSTGVVYSTMGIDFVLLQIIPVLSSLLFLPTLFFCVFFGHLEPINIFHGSYNTNTPPIRLSYHHGNHYNSLVDPRRLTVGAGLGFSCLRGVRYSSFHLCLGFFTFFSQ